MNDGSQAEPKFRSTNELLEAGGSPIAVGKVSTLRMLDWDGDGDHDLVVSTAGQGYGSGKGGAVHLFLNEGGKDKNASFAKGIEILPALPKENAPEATRPETGLYVDFADIDGDDDLDMVVGGYSWVEKKRHPYVWFYENTTKS